MKIDYTLFLPSENKTYRPSEGLIRDSIKEQNINQILADNSQGKTFLLNLLSYALFLDVTHRKQLTTEILSRISKYENTEEFQLAYSIEITLQNGRVLELNKDANGPRKAAIDKQSYGPQNLLTELEVLYDIPQNPWERILKVVSNVGKWNTDLLEQVQKAAMLLNRIDKALGHVRDENVITSLEEEIKKEKTRLEKAENDGKAIQNQIREYRALILARSVISNYTELEAAQIKYADAETEFKKLKKPAKTAKKNSNVIKSKRQSNALALEAISTSTNTVTRAIEDLSTYADVTNISNRFVKLNKDWSLAQLEESDWASDFTHFKNTIKEIITDVTNCGDKLLETPEYTNLQQLDYIKTVLERTLGNAGLKQIFTEKLNLNIDEILDKISDVLEDLTIINTVNNIKEDLSKIPEKVAQLGKAIHDNVKVIQTELLKGDGKKDDGKYDQAKFSLDRATRGLEEKKRSLKENKVKLSKTDSFKNINDRKEIVTLIQNLTSKYRNVDVSRLESTERDIQNRKIPDIERALTSKKARVKEEKSKSNAKFDEDEIKRLSFFTKEMKFFLKNLNHFASPIEKYESGEQIIIDDDIDSQFIDITGSMIAQSLNNFILRANGERKEIESFNIATKKFICTDGTSVLSSEVSTGLTTATYLAQKIRLATKNNLFFFFDEIAAVSDVSLEIVNDAIKEKMSENKSVTAIFTAVDNYDPKLKVKHLL